MYCRSDKFWSGRPKLPVPSPTIGSSKSGFTFGLGYGFSGGDFSNQPVVMLGGELQASKGSKFLGEMWFFPGGDKPVGIIGIRLFGDRLASDLGFMLIPGATVGIPWVDFVYNFGK